MRFNRSPSYVSQALAPGQTSAIPLNVEKKKKKFKSVSKMKGNSRICTCVLNSFPNWSSYHCSSQSVQNAPPKFYDPWILSIGDKTKHNTNLLLWNVTSVRCTTCVLGLKAHTQSCFLIQLTPEFWPNTQDQWGLRDVSGENALDLGQKAKKKLLGTLVLNFSICREKGWHYFILQTTVGLPWEHLHLICLLLMGRPPWQWI